MTEIRFTTTRTSRRAWKWSNYQMRWFPMPVADAELAIATGAARDITAEYKARKAAAAARREPWALHSLA